MITWKEIPNYENYKISTNGKIKSLNRGTILKPQSDRNNYQMVRLYKSGRGKTFRIHKLMQLCFMENKDCEINHKDGNKKNNTLKNLEESDRSTNINHSFHDITSGHQCKFDRKEIKEIRSKYKSEDIKQYELADEYGCDPSLISRIVNKKRYGYI